MSACNKYDPIVLEGKGFTIHHFIEYIIQTHASPTNLIICSTRNAFLQELLAEVNLTASRNEHQQEQQQQHQDGHDKSIPQSKEEDDHDKEQQPSSSLNLLLPTLDLLASSRTVKVSFCPDITHLLAHLSLLPYKTDFTYPSPSHIGPNDDNNDDDDEDGEEGRTASKSIKRPVLAILNPIRLHRPTSSFSAQGFNRTLASAVETANLVGQQLVVFESIASQFGGSAETAALLSDDEYNDQDMDDHDGLDESLDDETVSRSRHSTRQSSDKPWDEQLSILNVTTKTFGVGDRGWAGRTISIRQVAERWCRFTTPC